MASLFKKTFAVVLALAMVFTCLTVNAANEAPSISISNAYIEKDEEVVSLKISTENFDAIYGSDFTITIPEGYTFNSIVSDGDVWQENSNYVVDYEGDTIRFLDVRTDKGITFTLNLNNDGTAAALSDVELAKNMFVDTYEAEYTGVVLNNGIISIIDTPVEKGEVPTASAAANKGYFIPYGSVKDSEGKYADKDVDGNFPTGVNVAYFKLPTEEIGVTTFGASEKAQDDKGDQGIQFGSYAINAADKTYGTLVVMGDFANFKSVYSSLSDVQIYNRFAELYKKNNPADGTLKIAYTSGGQKTTVTIAFVAQKKYMWKGQVNGVNHLQYAVRVTNPSPRMYTSVAYSITDDVYTYSKEVKEWEVKAAQ